MDASRISELTEKLEIASEAYRRSEERAVAGLLSLEMMHEIRNPLEALGYLTHLAEQEADDPSKVRDYMHKAAEQLATITSIASQTLGFARSSSTPTSTEILALAEAALRIHQRTIEAKKIHLVKDVARDIAAKVHKGQMLQVISNLVVNALDAMPLNGTLCLRLRKRRDEVHFVISDNGHGIRKEHSDRIFEPFFTTKEEKGTGLGLSLSRKIVESHKGRICMRSSVRPGKCGTTFKICLPA